MIFWLDISAHSERENCALKMEYMLLQIRESFGVTKVPLQATLVLCFVLGAAGWVDAASTSTQQSPRPSAAFNSSFAIADFDGDRKPDLATVEIQKGGSSGRTQYSIRLQLTVGAAQIFGVTAPAGGLQIVAKDVNGDDALDMVVSTALQHQQVAVLLNDGHGKFTLADPGAFPSAVRNSQAEWAGATTQIHDNVVIPSSRSSAKASRVCAGAFLAGDESELTALFDFHFHSVQLDSGCADRAPPFAVLHV
jgi:hypothetical protein